MSGPDSAAQPTLDVVPLTSDRLDEAARVHIKAFPGFFLSSLGPAVLREFYRAHLLSPTAHCWVALDPSGRLVGVVAGTSTPGSFYREMLRRNPLRLGWAVAFAALRRPMVLKRIVDGLRHGAPVPYPVDDAALLSSVCVDPGARAGGVGAQLLKTWVDGIAASGQAEAAYLTTDAVDNDPVMRWYSANGWSLLGTFERHDGRAMAAYRRELPATPSS